MREKEPIRTSNKEASKVRKFTAAAVTAGVLFGGGVIYSLTGGADAQGVPCDPVIDNNCEPDDTLIKPTSTTGPTTTMPPTTTTMPPTTTTMPPTTTTQPPVVTVPPVVSIPAETK